MRPQRLITLEAWAKATYGDSPPSAYTLRRWVKAGHIFPMPEKQGRCYRVVENARYVADYNNPSFARGLHDASQTQ